MLPRKFFLAHLSKEARWRETYSYNTPIKTTKTTILTNTCQLLLLRLRLLTKMISVFGDINWVTWMHIVLFLIALNGMMNELNVRPWTLFACVDTISIHLLAFYHTWAIPDVSLGASVSQLELSGLFGKRIATCYTTSLETA